MQSTARTTPRAKPRQKARAFALPLVTMLVLIASIVLALVLNQQSSASLAVARQVAGYQSHHDAQGLREIATRWLTTVRNRTADSLDDDGLAFRMRMPKSGTVEVRMRDGQGPCLRDTSVLSGRRRVIVDRMNELLSAYAQADPAAGGAEPAPEAALQRPAGPPQVSYSIAPAPVLEALCFAVVQDPSRARRAARILANRAAYAADPAPTKRAVSALRDLGLSQTELAEIEGMLVDRCTLWFITAEIADARGRVVTRSGGLYEAGDQRVEPFNQNAGFLTWEVLPLE